MWEEGLDIFLTLPINHNLYLKNSAGCCEVQIQRRWSLSYLERMVGSMKGPVHLISDRLRVLFPL